MGERLPHAERDPDPEIDMLTRAVKVDDKCLHVEGGFRNRAGRVRRTQPDKDASRLQPKNQYNDQPALLALGRGTCLHIWHAPSVCNLVAGIPSSATQRA